MDTKIDCEGFWFAGEIADAVEAEYGFRPEISTSDGAVIVHPRPRSLSSREETWVREYLKGHLQKSSEERMAEEEQAEEIRRQQLQESIHKLTSDTGITLRAADVREAIVALAELVGLEVGGAGDTKEAKSGH